MDKHNLLNFIQWGETLNTGKYKFHDLMDEDLKWHYDALAREVETMFYPRDQRIEYSTSYARKPHWYFDPIGVNTKPVVFNVESVDVDVDEDAFEAIILGGTPCKR